MSSLFHPWFTFILTLFLANPGLAGELYNKIDALFRPDFPDAEAGPGAVLLVARGDAVIYRGALGKADLERNVRLQPDNVFRLGSLTKQFTACAILRLVEAGKLSLDDDIHRFVPDFPTQGQVITIEHLLTHTSGLQDFTRKPDFLTDTAKRDFTPRELIELFHDALFDSTPGERFSYNNAGYLLLGYIIEVVTGGSYAAFVEKELFAPLQMRHSYIERGTELIPRRANGYRQRGQIYENASYLSMTVPYSAGGAVSTLEDLHRWIIALASGRVISAENLQRAWRPYRLRMGKLSTYGYGWELGNVQGVASVRHVGRINGFVSYILYLPSERIFVALLSNCEADRNLEFTASLVAAEAMGKPFDRTAVAVAPDALESVQGVYVAEDGARYALAKESERLVFMPLGGDKMELFPTGPDRFCFAKELSTIQVQRDHRGSVTRLEVSGLNSSIRLVRSEEVRTPLHRIAVTASTLDRYIGRYEFSPQFVLNVTRERQALIASAFGRKVELVPFGEGAFYAQDIDLQLIFAEGPDGQMSVTKHQNGEATAPRISR